MGEWKSEREGEKESEDPKAQSVGASSRSQKTQPNKRTPPIGAVCAAGCSDKALNTIGAKL